MKTSPFTYWALRYSDGEEKRIFYYNVKKKLFESFIELKKPMTKKEFGLEKEEADSIIKQQVKTGMISERFSIQLMDI